MGISRGPQENSNLPNVNGCVQWSYNANFNLASFFTPTCIHTDLLLKALEKTCHCVI